jgi:exonuclease VII small subunit
MLSQGIRFFFFKPSIVCCALLALSLSAIAQRHGGASSGSPSMGNLSSYSRPDGVNEGDSLKDFHRAVAEQATSQQIAEFQEMIKATSAAQDKLHALTATNTKPSPDAASSLDQVFADARTRNKKFQDGFSEPQKSGLREITKRLEKDDADLDQELKRFDQGLLPEAQQADLSARAAALDKALADFSNEQLALGREMSITLATGQDLSFNLPKVRNHVNVGHGAIAIDVSGELSQTAAQADRRTFQLQSTLDLSELQRNITEIANDQLASNGCGVRLAVRRATIMADTPASSLVLQLHYERWSCTQSFGQTELAEADGSVEIKLTPAVDKSGSLSLASEFKRIDANGMMANDLRSGDLGDTVRDKVSSSVLLALQSGADFGSTLPGVLKNEVTLQAARFQDPGSSGLKAVLEGQVTLSNEQANLLASQLNQTLSAQGTPAAQGTTPAQGSGDPAKFSTRQ